LELDEKRKKESLKAIKEKEVCKKQKAKKKKTNRSESTSSNPTTLKSNSTDNVENDSTYKCKHQAKSEQKSPKTETSTSLSPSQCQITKSPNKSPTIIAKLELQNEECKCDDERDFVHKLPEIQTTNFEIGQEERFECNKSCCFDIINYWNKLVEEDKQKEIKLIESKKLNNLDLFDGEESFDIMFNNQISQEEINDYYANRANYLESRIKNRKELQRKFEILKSKSNLKIRLRNF
jgi:hypothetical protein